MKRQNRWRECNKAKENYNFVTEMRSIKVNINHAENSPKQFYHPMTQLLNTLSQSNKKV